MRPSRLVLLASMLACALPAVAEGATSSTTSSNWSGYAVTGKKFKRVSASWRIPEVDCTNGEGYSASWVGLGGYSLTSKALEQTGTESDCNASGRASYTAWWELVPDVAHTTRLRVGAGDRVTASVEVKGLVVTLRLADRTRGTSFKKIVRAGVVDVSSAEWILEAPAECSGNDTSSCSALPLADFGASTFSQARAVTVGGHAGTISDNAFNSIAITLAPGGGASRGPQNFATRVLGAFSTPSHLSANGGAFDIAYSEAGSGDPATSASAPAASASIAIAARR